MPRTTRGHDQKPRFPVTIQGQGDIGTYPAYYDFVGSLTAFDGSYEHLFTNHVLIKDSKDFKYQILWHKINVRAYLIPHHESGLLEITLSPLNPPTKK